MLFNHLCFCQVIIYKLYANFGVIKHYRNYIISTIRTELWKTNSNSKNINSVNKNHRTGVLRANSQDFSAELVINSYSIKKKMNFRECEGMRTATPGKHKHVGNTYRREAGWNKQGRTQETDWWARGAAHPSIRLPSAPHPQSGQRV